MEARWLNHNTLLSHCLFQPRCINGRCQFYYGGNLVMTSHSIQGVRVGSGRGGGGGKEREEILLVTSCCRNCCIVRGSEADINFSQEPITRSLQLP